MIPVTVKIESDTLSPALQALGARIADLTPLMRNIAGILESEIEDNFAAEGRPAWDALSPVTIARREKSGHWPGKKLQVTGQLAASVESAHTSTEAVAGTNKEYAKTHQFGAKKGEFGKYSLLLKSGKQKDTFKKSPVINIPWGDIPARPFINPSRQGIADIEAAVLAYATAGLK